MLGGESVAKVAQQREMKQEQSRAMIRALSADFPQTLERMLPDIGADARAELARWEERIDDWEFDVFRIAELTNGRPLCFVFSVVMLRHQLCAKFGIDRHKLHALGMALDRGYAEQATAPYHNSIHGADVIQAVNYFLRAHLCTSTTLGGSEAGRPYLGAAPGRGGDLADTELLACILSAAVHDIGHPGKTNRWHTEVSSPLAMLYNGEPYILGVTITTSPSFSIHMLDFVTKRQQSVEWCAC